MSVINAKTKNHQLSTHILNIATGMPAPAVSVELYKHNDGNDSWELISTDKTNESGRISSFLEGKENIGVYKLIFRTAEYFKKRNEKSFYPFIPVVFEISNANHYLVPITLSPFGYSTYRGS